MLMAECCVGRLGLVFAALLALVSWAAPVDAQSVPPVIEGTQEIDFDRPEAWAMKWTASLTMLTSLGPPRTREGGVVDLGLELDWIPSLSEEQRRVGFNGTKAEDFNRVDVLPRPRVAIGLGRGASLELAYLPPVTVEGITPNLLSAALELPIVRAGNWTFGVRAHGQIGTVEGDITCPAAEAAIPPGEPGNEFGCMERSSDEVSLDSVGLGLLAGYRIPGTNATDLHFGVFATSMDLEFQVDALTFGIRDRTRLVTDGWTFAATAGVSFPLSSTVRLAAEAYYAPLDVVRPPATAADNDGLFNLRSMISYRF
jgi:hypothetical protein